MPGTETRFYVSQAFPVSKLSKGQAQKLVQTNEVFNLVVASVALHALMKLVIGHFKIGHLIKTYSFVLALSFNL